MDLDGGNWGGILDGGGGRLVDLDGIREVVGRSSELLDGFEEDGDCKMGEESFWLKKKYCEKMWMI